MMSWNDYLRENARKTASRRKRIYGIEPSPVVTNLLERERTDLSFREACRLTAYILFKSPKRRLKLFWRILSDLDTPVRRQHIEALAQSLQIHLSPGCRITTDYFVRRNYSRDLARVPPLMETALHRTTPFLVVQPRHERDIADVLKFCRSKNLAAFPRGAASFAFGGAVPTRSGIVLDLSPMTSVLEIDPKELRVRVQPGARWADIAAELEPHDLALMTTPTSRFSTVAGWISTGGMGLDSFAFGSVYESVLGVRVARPNGMVEELTAADASLEDLFGTEGQLGILTEITLRIRLEPDHSGACLFTFATIGQAFDFIRRLDTGGSNPSHVVYFDPEYLRRENILFSELTGAEGPVIPEEHAVLLHFDSAEKERKFMARLNGNGEQVSQNRVSARYLWADRFFPLKAQRIGPGLLGSEVVIPGAAVPKYVNKVNKLARRFNLEPATEVIVCRDEGSFSNLVIVSFPCDYSRSLHYVLCLLVIQLLVRMAVRYGGHPYGIGIWNTPFVAYKYDRNRLERLKRKKQDLDPTAILNPNKFFKIKGRFYSIPALFLRPSIFRAILNLAHYFAPLLGVIARLVEPKRTGRWEVPAKEVKQGKSLLHQSAQRCTSCGSCISVCPAYLLTRDELVSGRAKLRMAEVMLNGVDLNRKAAHAPFQCLHCGLCEEVCQTHLPLRDCYLVLESWLEERFGSPSETVQSFIEKLDENRDFIREVFGLILPDWSPVEPPSRVPAAERPAAGGEA